MADLITMIMTIAYPEREMRMLSIVPLAFKAKSNEFGLSSPTLIIRR